MFCANCGKTLAEGATRCPWCGTPLTQAVKQVLPATVQPRQMSTIPLLCLLCSIGLFLASLTQSAFCLGDCNNQWRGVWVLLFGWGAMLLGGNAVCFWFANPLLFVAWITFRYPRVSLWFSIFAVTVSAAFLLFTGITMGNLHNNELDFTPIVHRHLGYWLWLSSMIIMLVGNGSKIIVLHNEQELPPEMSGTGTFQWWRTR